MSKPAINPKTVSDAIMFYRDCLAAADDLLRQAKVLNDRACALEKKIVESTCGGKEIYGQIIIQVDGTLWRIDPSESLLRKVAPIEDFSGVEL